MLAQNEAYGHDSLRADWFAVFHGGNPIMGQIFHHLQGCFITAPANPTHYFEIRNIAIFIYRKEYQYPTLNSVFSC